MTLVSTRETISGQNCTNKCGFICKHTSAEKIYTLIQKNKLNEKNFRLVRNALKCNIIAVMDKMLIPRSSRDNKRTLSLKIKRFIILNSPRLKAQAISTFNPPPFLITDKDTAIVDDSITTNKEANCLKTPDYTCSENSSGLCDAEFWDLDGAGKRKSCLNFPSEYYFTVTEGNHIYAFDIRQLNKMINNDFSKNPYTMEPLTEKTISDITNKISELQAQGKDIVDKDEQKAMSQFSEKQKLHFRVLTLFQEIERKASYIMDPAWITELTIQQLRDFYINLYRKWWYEMAYEHRRPLSEGLDGLLIYNPNDIKYMQCDSQQAMYDTLLSIVVEQIEIICRTDMALETKDYMGIWMMMIVIEETSPHFGYRFLRN
jgi:hypothetical protein